MGRTRPGPPRTELARARIRLGLSQQDAAEAVGVSPTTWSRWERGGQNLRPAYRARIARLFAVDPFTVEQWLDGTGATRPPTATALFPAADFEEHLSASTVDSFDHLWRSDMDPARREMLAALPFVPSALGEWLTAWNFDPPLTLPVDRPADGRVRSADVARIREAHEAFVRMDHQFGSGLIRPAVVDYLNTTVAPLLRRDCDDRVRAELMAAAGEMVLMAGWSAFDLGRHGQAQRYFGQALQLAKAAGDPMAAVDVMTTMTLQALHLREPIWAGRLAQAAVETARRAQATPRVMAMLLTRQAWAIALRVNSAEGRDAHAAREVGRLLNEAQDAYARGSDDRDPSWMDWYEETEPVAEAGRCWYLLGEHRRSADCTERCLAVYTERRFRTAQFTYVSAAEAYLGMGELEQAVESARTAIPMARRLTSARAIERLRVFADRLTPYEDSVCVREFRDQLNERLAA